MLVYEQYLQLVFGVFKYGRLLTGPLCLGVKNPALSGLFSSLLLAYFADLRRDAAIALRMSRQSK